MPGQLVSFMLRVVELESPAPVLCITQAWRTGSAKIRSYRIRKMPGIKGERGLRQRELHRSDTQCWSG